MIVLDTNVISEMMKSADQRSAAVSVWLSRNHSADLFTTAVNVAEIFAGIEGLPPGRRRTAIETSAERVIGLFDGRVLPIDDRAARDYANITGDRQRRGRPIYPLDAQIIAIAVSNRMAVATRDIRDCSDAGAAIIDPWGLRD